MLKVEGNWMFFHMCQGLNSHYFHIIGDGKLNPIVGVYIPIIRIPIKGGMTIPNTATFDHGTYFFIFVGYYLDITCFLSLVPTVILSYHDRNM